MKLFSVLCFLCMAITFLEAKKKPELEGHNATKLEEHHDEDGHDHDHEELFLEGE